MTDSTTPQDDAAMPPASTGSVEPVAWAVEDSSGVFAVDLSFSEMDRRRDRAHFKSPCRIVPLYRQPQPTLTEAEREALDIVSFSGLADRQTQDAIGGLLDRTAGGEG